MCSAFIMTNNGSPALGTETEMASKIIRFNNMVIISLVKINISISLYISMLDILVFNSELAMQ